MSMIQVCSECPFFNDGKPIKRGQKRAVCSTMPKGYRLWRELDQPICAPMSKSTAQLILWNMFDKPNVGQARCAVCGSTHFLNHHHVIRRSAGNLFGADGKPRRKPTIMLCGSGNTDGCHGKAHSGLLHFRWRDGWEYLLLDEPTDYLTALDMDGWKRLRTWAV